MTASLFFACAPLDSASLTGLPTTPTATIGTSTAQIASCAFVLGQASSDLPSANGIAASGIETMFARGDHVHPADPSKAPSVNPTLTGTITLNGPTLFTSTQIDKAYALASPAQNGLVTIAGTTHVQIVTPPAALAGIVAVSVQFPAPQDGLRFECAATAAITKLTCIGAGTIQNAPTSMSAGSSFEYLYVASNSTWVRIR